MSNQSLRILTGLLGIVLVIGLLYLGGWYFSALVLVIACVALYEFYGLAHAGGYRPYVVPGLICGTLGVLLFPLPEVFPILFAAVVLMAALSFLDRHERPLQNLAITLGGLIYPVLFLAVLIGIRNTGGMNPDAGFYLTLMLFIGVWSADTFAYFAGRAFGKHPLAPTVSPKKTWEGAIGGVLGTLITIGLFSYYLLPELSWKHAAAVALICSTLGPAGDLAESRMKRSVGIKDSGTILPGHGGMLDRFDAMAIAAPLFYLYMRYVAQFGY